MLNFKLFYFFVDYNIGIMIVYLPVLLRNLHGIEEATIGSLFLLAGLVSIVGALTSGYIGQNIKDERKILQLGVLGLLIGALLVVSTSNLLIIALSFVFIFFVRSALYTIGDELAITHIHNSKGGDFGKVRSFGSIGWALNFFISGVLISGYPTLFIINWVVAIMFLLITTFRIPKIIVEEHTGDFKISDVKHIIKII
mgnify:FL=1